MALCVKYQTLPVDFMDMLTDFEKNQLRELSDMANASYYNWIGAGK